jgi:hypothetical protein
MTVIKIILVIVFSILSQMNSDFLYTILYVSSILILFFLPNTIVRITFNLEVLN